MGSERLRRAGADNSDAQPSGGTEEQRQGKSNHNLNL